MAGASSENRTQRRAQRNSAATASLQYRCCAIYAKNVRVRLGLLRSAEIKCGKWNCAYNVRMRRASMIPPVSPWQTCFLKWGPNRGSERVGAGVGSDQHSRRKTEGPYRETVNGRGAGAGLTGPRGGSTVEHRLALVLTISSWRLSLLRWQGRATRE